MTPAQRIFEVMGDMLVKSLVLVVADIGAASGPQRLRLVDRLPPGLGRDAFIRCVVVSVGFAGSGIITGTEI